MGQRSNTLKYFMWGYQTYFQGAAQALAGSLFKKLDPRFSPEVILVGFIREPEKGWHTVCIEPEECEYVPAQFAGIRELAQELIETDPKSHTFQTLPEAQASQDAFVNRRSLQRAVEQTISELAASEFVCLCSMPVVVGRYDVIAVLLLQADVYKSHYHLQKKFLRWDESRVARSYLEATALVFLEACIEELNRPDPGINLVVFHRDYSDIPRYAADLFASRVAHASERFGMAGDLFSILNTISAMFYEKKAGMGSLTLARREHENVQPVVMLAEGVPLSSHRAIRKLVEVSSDSVSLLCDGESVYGLGVITDGYDPLREDLFQISFTDHYTWSVSHAGNVMMRIAHNLPLTLLPKVDGKKLASDLFRLFAITREEQAAAFALVQEAAELGHGTQLIFSSVAEQEAIRLSPQAMVINPVVLTPELLRIFCSVDGAVLLDPQGRCHAFGVILDGRVSTRGDRSRGSRYNSAVRYADGRSDCLIVVVSDDETIDFVPSLRPQASRSTIQQVLEILETIVQEGRDEEKDYTLAMNWLSSHRFYLSAEQCARVNDARRTVESRREWELGFLHISYDELSPNDEMNDFYLVD